MFYAKSGKNNEYFEFYIRLPKDKKLFTGNVYFLLIKIHKNSKNRLSSSYQLCFYLYCIVQPNKNNKTNFSLACSKALYKAFK